MGSLCATPVIVFVDLARARVQTLEKHTEPVSALPSVCSISGPTPVRLFTPESMVKIKQG